MQCRRPTSFGWLEVWAEEAGGVPVVERLHFDRHGRSHAHDRWEHVRVLGGEGVIVVGAKRIAVVAGDAVSIPPGVAYWMETGFGLDLVLLYGEEN